MSYEIEENAFDKIKQELKLAKDRIQFLEVVCENMRHTNESLFTKEDMQKAFEAGMNRAFFESANYDSNTHWIAPEPPNYTQWLNQYLKLK